MCDNGCQNEAKWRLGGSMGPLLEALGAMWVPRGAPMLKNDEKVTSITLRCGSHFGSFLLIFAVFDPSRPPEGHYDPCVVLRHDNQVVYGVDLLYSTWNNNITLISLRKVTDSGPKWSFLLIFTVFDCFGLLSVAGKPFWAVFPGWC